MTRARYQLLAGTAVAAVGSAGMAGYLPVMRDYTYPVVWWGVLAVIDALNLTFRRCSMWQGQSRRFFGVTLPVSVLFWLFFEALNLAAPQWRYFGSIRSVAAQVFFGFAAFSTVIPIVVEFWMLFGGGASILPVAGRWLVAHRWLFVASGLLLAAIPLFNDSFWFNQGMWLVPALWILPFQPAASAPAGDVFRRLALTGVASGLAWECLNWPARTHWEYLIVPGWPHLFQMPLIGYAGFVPFALSALAVYGAARRLPATGACVIALYVATIVLLSILTVLYIRCGLWVFI